MRSTSACVIRWRPHCTARIFRGAREWIAFILFSAAVGAMAGAEWSIGQRRATGFWRDWLGVFVVMALISNNGAVLQRARESSGRVEILVEIVIFVLASLLSTTVFAAPITVARRSYRSMAKS